MEWEMTYMAQKAMQARRERRMKVVGREIAGTDDTLTVRLEGQDVLGFDHGSNDDVEAATSLLGGGKSRYHHQVMAAATALVMGGRKEDEKDKGEAELRDHLPCPCLLAASLCPCYFLGRGATLLTRKEQEEGKSNGEREVERHLNSEGWWTCLSSCLLASVCPLPCLWPTLACTHRRRQRKEIKQQYPHFPSLTPSSSSSSSLSPSSSMGRGSSSSSSSSSSSVQIINCELLGPGPLVEEVAFLEEMMTVKRRMSMKGEAVEVEMTPVVPSEKPVAAKKADREREGRDPTWEPFEGWDMRPIAVTDAAALAAAAATAAASTTSTTEASGAAHEAGAERTWIEMQEDEKASWRVVTVPK